MRTTLLALTLLLQPASPLAAQSAPPPASVPANVDSRSQSPPVTEHQGDITFGALFSEFGRELKKLPSKETAITLGIGGALALAVHPADHTLTARAAASEPLDEVFDFGQYSGGGVVQGAIAFSTFVVGYAMVDHEVQAVGADLIQAQLLTLGMTQTIKVLADRERPNNGKYSFPSGHASATFATAAVLSRHYGWKAAIPAYGFASYVAVSRLPENRHFASDVIFGAALGIVAGRTMTVGRGSNRFAVVPMATRGGAGLTFTRIP